MDKIKDKMLTIALEEMNKRISDMGIYNPLNALVFKSGYKAGATNACENLLAMLVEKLGKDKVSEISIANRYDKDYLLQSSGNLARKSQCQKVLL